MTEEKEQMIKQAFDKAFNKNFGEDKEIIIDGGRMAGITTLKNEIARLEQENKELKEKLAKCKEILYNIYKAFDTCTPIENIEDYIEDEALMEEFFRKRDEEWNARSVG